MPSFQKNFVGMAAASLPSWLKSTKGLDALPAFDSDRSDWSWASSRSASSGEASTVPFQGFPSRLAETSCRPAGIHSKESGGVHSPEARGIAKCVVVERRIGTAMAISPKNGGNQEVEGAKVSHDVPRCLA